MPDWDSFTIAVLAGGAVIVIVFGLMIILDKGKPAVPPATAPAKAGKR